MFTEHKEDSIGALGEVRLIAQIRDWLGEVVPACPEGMGDDCAVVDAPAGLQILTTDSLSYGQHFDDTVSAHDAGAKLIKRNLSDIAAMGGRPGYALLTLLCGNDLRLDWLAAFIEGIRQTCRHYNVALVGGDISSLPKGHFSSVLSLTGYLQYPPLRRTGASKGDTIYVTGSLGGSIQHKHHGFEPRLAEGQWLAQSGACSALMDLTDGLAKDLRELLPPQCAAYLHMERIPLSEAACQRATETGRPPLEHAFCDGEDYELLFTVKAKTELDRFEADWAARFPGTPLSRIGQIGANEGGKPYLDIKTNTALPWMKGYEHLT
ncbi:MAG: thiamine-monophosphate kinase [Puniceicoccaceae bacterium]|nr:thiamine-monophosphate kinase [Puniceicoccaceae bacterium]